MCYYVPNYDIFIQSPILTHSTSSVQTAVVDASHCSSGNEVFFQLRTLYSHREKSRINVDLCTVR